MAHSTETTSYSYSSLIGAVIPYSLGEDEFRCPHCKCTQKGRWWISQAGDCMHCGNCWSDAFFRDRDGMLKPYVDPCLDLLFTSVAEHMASDAEVTLENIADTGERTHVTVTAMTNL